MGKQFRENVKETTYGAMSELKKWGESYIGIPIHHINQYIWRILDILPEGDEEVWGIFKKHPQEYYTAIKIRDASRSIGGDFKKSFLLGKEERANFPTTGYIQITTLIENENKRSKGP